MEELITIPKYFKNKTVFITGGSGFMGKVLIEKILRSCPEVLKIYILIRAKKGKSPDERIKQITEIPLFDRLRNENPGNLKKLIPIEGNVNQLKLGLSTELRKKLIEEVNIVFHAAATIRFDEPLKDAILMNTRGAREVAYLVLEMIHLEVLVHISTAYSNTKIKVIGEQMYPAYSDWREAITIAENVESNTIDILTQKFLNGLPNTYVYTKNLAEHVIYDICNGKIPVVIFRPSIVISSYNDPIPGWIDNFNGPIGMLVGTGKGVLRTFYTDKSIQVDYVPVDTVIKAILVTTWLKALENDKFDEQHLEASIYNGSNNSLNNRSGSEVDQIAEGMLWNVPLGGILWYPKRILTKCYFMYLFRFYVYQLLPALLADLILKLIGRKPMLFRLQRKLFIVNMALEYFMLQEWSFVNDKLASIDQRVISSDKKDFAVDVYNIDLETYVHNLILGAKKYLLKEDIDLEKDKAHNKRMYIIYLLFNLFWYIGLYYITFIKLDLIGLLGKLLDRFCVYFQSL